MRCRRGAHHTVLTWPESWWYCLRQRWHLLCSFSMNCTRPSSSAPLSSSDELSTSCSDGQTPSHRQRHKQLVHKHLLSHLHPHSHAPPHACKHIHMPLSQTHTCRQTCLDPLPLVRHEAQVVPSPPARPQLLPQSFSFAGSMILEGAPEGGRMMAHSSTCVCWCGLTSPGQGGASPASIC